MSSARQRQPCSATGAILLWATLASLTVLTGADPAVPDHGHRLCHRRRRDRAGRRRCAGRAQPAPADAGLAGARHLRPVRLPRALLRRPAAWRRRPRRSLISSLWALLTVLFSGLLPGHRLRPAHVVGALLGLRGRGAAGVGQARRRQRRRRQRPLGFVLAFGCALVWSSYSVASRLLAAVPSESIAVLVPRDRRAGLRLQPRCSSNGSRRPARVAWLALVGLGLGPVGAAFLLWDIGMKKGNVSPAAACSPTRRILLRHRYSVAQARLARADSRRVGHLRRVVRIGRRACRRQSSPPSIRREC